MLDPLKTINITDKGHEEYVSFIKTQSKSQIWKWNVKYFIIKFKLEDIKHLFSNLFIYLIQN